MSAAESSPRAMHVTVADLSPDARMLVTVTRPLTPIEAMGAAEAAGRMALDFARVSGDPLVPDHLVGSLPLVAEYVAAVARAEAYRMLGLPSSESDDAELDRTYRAMRASEQARAEELLELLLRETPRARLARMTRAAAAAPGGKHRFERGGTWAPEAPEWLRRADIEWCEYEVVDGVLHWHDGVWDFGIWQGGIWHDGTWHGGVWWRGDWRDGTWHDGTWYGGTWYRGTWYRGTKDTLRGWICPRRGLRFTCGCFSGDLAALQAYIAAGPECLRDSRTRALRIVLELLDQTPKETP